MMVHIFLVKSSKHVPKHKKEIMRPFGVQHVLNNVKYVI